MTARDGLVRSLGPSFGVSLQKAVLRCGVGRLSLCGVELLDRRRRGILSLTLILILVGKR